VSSARALRFLEIRTRRIVDVIRLRASLRRRRELLVMDYVLPVVLRLRRPPLLRLGARSDAAEGTLFFGRESFAVDRIAYFGVFLEGWYEADFRGALVVDVGGHKGYFGAYALLEGAAEARSYEPESRNFAALELSAATFGPRWIAHRAAVGSTSGAVELHVSAESAGHSVVHEEHEGERRVLGSESVEMVAMRDVLEAAAPHRGRLIVKVDAEGSECDIVLGTPVDMWRKVDHVFLEVHEFATCTSRDLVDHLGAAGLRVVRHTVDAEAELLALAR
jgi:FkbM family methyltransferase